MRLNNIYPAKGSKKSAKRVGRGIGSGLGKTCSLGHKGQNSRTGGGVRRGFEGGQTPIYRRLPKFGFISKKSIIHKEVRLSDLSKIKQEFIDLKTLKMFNIVNNKIKFVKVILSGKITHAITIRSLSVTKGARVAITNIGGKIYT